MIDYIKGEITDISPTNVTIEAYGVGYGILISLNTYTALSGKASAKLFIYEAIREDAHQLFGFFDKHERDLFIHLISVSGIGPGTARMMLSSMNPVELEHAIVSENVDLIKSVKGIGAKTAQRVIIDLKDKVKLSGNIESSLPLANSQVSEESIAALVMLGFPQVASQKVVAKILKNEPNSTIEQIVKNALKML